MRRAIVAAAVLASGWLPAAAAEAARAPARPKVVLVLSGGGARGAAHVGVLKVLEEYRVPVDMIVGSSMGAIVGGLYAAGWSADEIEAKLTTVDWGSVFIDRLPRQVRTYRRKSDDARFLVPLKMRFRRFKPYLPPALLGGQALELLFQGLEIEATGERDFDEFPIPYRAVATDLATGDVVILREGSLASAMRASMALPGVFPPVDIDGKSLADGGMAAILPIRIARSLGAEVVIGVDITSPLRGKERLGNLLTRLDQATSLLANANKAEDLKAVRREDVILVPALGDITFSDFSHAADAVAAGAASARAREARLRALSVPDEAWAERRARLHRRPPEDRVVDEIRITNTGPLADAVVARRLDVPLHVPLDEAKLSSQLLQLYGLDAFGPIHHDLVREGGRGILKIDTPSKPYGIHSLQFGFNALDDFRGDSAFNVSLSHLMNPVDRRGGEWRNILQLGHNEYVGTEFYQPLDDGMAWFVKPEASIRRDRYRVYDDGGNALAEYRVRQRRTEVSFGRVLRDWGEVTLGAFRSNEDGRPKVGPDAATTFDAADGGLAAAFRVDRLDSVTWPRRGLRADVVYARSIEAWGADASGGTVRVAVERAGTLGKNVLLGSFECGRTIAGSQDLANKFLLGGFLRLSGLAQNQLVGDRGGLARLLYYRELSSFNLGSLTQRMYAGFSVEAGSVYGAGDPVTWPSLRRAGSVYVGADTVIGPAFLGFGYAEGGRKSAYLVIGQRF